MKLLFIVDHNSDTNLNQVMMFAPDEYDHAKVRREAQECGVTNPNILAVVDVSDSQAARLQGYVNDYAVYAR